MKSLFLSLIALSALVLSASTAQAGGGSKATSTVTVTNNTSSRIAVIVDPNSTITNLIGTGDTTLTTAQLNQFKAAGGRIVNAGASTSFTAVKTGSHTIAAAEVDTTTGDVTTVNQLDVTTQKGKTVRVSATDDGAGSVVLTQTSSN